MIRVCLVAHYKTSLIEGDLGTKLVAHHLSEEVIKSCDIKKVDISDIFFNKSVKRFNPQIVHFILAPSLLGLLIPKLFGMLLMPSKVLVSAPNPSSLSYHQFIRFLKPDLLLVQSYDSEKMFCKMGFKTFFFPNGVDINKFVPVGYDEKMRLRRKYGINEKKFIILLVGPIIAGRNIHALKDLQDDNNQILVIGRANADQGLLKSLKQSGFIIMIEHIASIEEIYALSDCYIFPTDPREKDKCIECPLSVLEAMACNLPIITTRFGALPRIFNADGMGLFFIDDISDILKLTKLLREKKLTIRTREQVIPYSWDAIGKQLHNIYLTLI